MMLIRLCSFSAAAAAAGAGAGAGAAAAAAGANSSSNTGPGFSEADLEAEDNGGLTLANAPTGNNSLGLDIECVSAQMPDPDVRC